LPNPSVSNVPEHDSFAEANALWNHGRFEEAERAYLGILKDRPNSAWALYRLSEINQRRANESAAKDFFARAIALNPALGEVNARAEFWKCFKSANELLEQRNLASAEPMFRDLLERDANCAPVLAKLGRIAGELGRVHESLELYERAIATDNHYMWGHIGKAEMLGVSGDIEGAASILEFVTHADPSIAVVQDRLQALRKKQRHEKEGADAISIRHWAAEASRPAETAPNRPHMAVVTWCLAHNPAGRAMVLAEVAAPHAQCEIVGPIFPAYGEDLWPPLRESSRDVEVHGFVAPTFAAFLEGAIRLVMERPCEIAWVSKPRLPGMIIGFLYKHIHGASVILDIDDDELAFVRADQPLSLDEFLRDHSPPDWREPYARRWTQLAVGMIAYADAISVCNPVLQRKYGGTIVRHARGARQFEQARLKRGAVRKEFGFSDSDKIVLFLGTPRRHKGVLDVARALGALADPRAVFCIIGTIRDKELRKELESFTNVRLALHPDQPYSRLAELNAMADVVCVLQDPSDPISQSQTPAKLTDAIATGTTILATLVPPVLDLVEGGGIISVSEKNLVEALAAALSKSDEHTAEARRTYFHAELSIEANASRAREIIEAARAKNAAIPDDVRCLFESIDASMPGSLPKECLIATKGLLRNDPPVAPLRDLSQGVNLVFFWKQNDSSIYGRRQDMLLKQFAAMPNINKILHVDAPISADALNGLTGAEGQSGQGRFVAANTINRFLQIEDDDRLFRRTFVYRGKETHLLGRELPSIEEFPNAIESWLNDLAMKENVFAWVCPVVRNFPDVQRRIGFSFVAIDVIDDQRRWPMHPAWRVQIDRNYRETFSGADAAFANCEAVGQWLRDEGLASLVVPNGMDMHKDVDAWAVPETIARLRRPIVGYCGNLSHRIDWDLIDHVAVSRPDWSIVLIGEPAKDERCRATAARRNVHMLGVIPYETALRHIAAFDAAMIPHLDSVLSAHMNPLKLYVYCSVGVPVVSAAVANLDDLAGEIRIAESPARFVEQLEAAIAARRGGRVYPSARVIEACSWQSRANAIWRRLEEVFESRRQKAGLAA
jgi:glycosyltransferase involved in cell wall biosynthesis